MSMLMPDNESVLKPSADAAVEKTEVSIKASAGKIAKHDGNTSKMAAENCEAVRNMASLENPLHNTSPNATNIQD